MTVRTLCTEAGLSLWQYYEINKHIEITSAFQRRRWFGFVRIDLLLQNIKIFKYMDNVLEKDTWIFVAVLCSSLIVKLECTNIFRALTTIVQLDLLV